MRKLFLTLAILALAIPCFASTNTYVLNTDDTVISPAALGALTTASTATITTAYGALALGDTSNISKVLVSVPVGTAYVGTSSVSQADGFALAATQGVLELDVNSLEEIYWTGPTGQTLSFIVIK